MPPLQAQSFIDSYFDRYPKVKEFLELTKEEARQSGFTKTLLGRRCYFPDIRSSNQNLRQFAERAAINAPIQGSAADIIKIAMIEIERELETESFASAMILQVHDELVFDVLESELGQLEKLVRAQMEGAYQLSVPLKVDMKIGTSWYHE